MTQVASWIRKTHNFIANPGVLALIVAVNVAAFFGGLVLWYGYVMADPATPVWVWPFVPDCPLFGLLGALALLLVTARDFWSPATQAEARRMLYAVAVVSGLAYLFALGPWASSEIVRLRATLAMWTASVALCAVFFYKTPAWLLAIIAFGQIKYGIWTITAWSLFWRNTTVAMGSPLLTPESVLMTATHVGLALQGLALLTYFRPDIRAAIVACVWFFASDFVDYGLGYYPAIPEEFIALTAMKWSTISVTVALSVLFFWVALQARIGPSHVEGTVSKRKQGASQFV